MAKGSGGGGRGRGGGKPQPGWEEDRAIFERAEKLARAGRLHTLEGFDWDDTQVLLDLATSRSADLSENQMRNMLAKNLGVSRKRLDAWVRVISKESDRRLSEW